MNQAKGFTLAAIGFAVSAAGFYLGHRWGLAAGMAGLSVMYAALAYRAKTRSGNPAD